jgi:hypothetical protein
MLIQISTPLPLLLLYFLHYRDRIEQNRYGSVIDEDHLHFGTENAGFNLDVMTGQGIAEMNVEAVALVRGCSS